MDRNIIAAAIAALGVTACGGSSSSSAAGPVVSCTVFGTPSGPQPSQTVVFCTETPTAGLSSADLQAVQARCTNGEAFSTTSGCPAANRAYTCAWVSDGSATGNAPGLRAGIAATNVLYQPETLQQAQSDCGEVHGTLTPVQ